MTYYLPIVLPHTLLSDLLGWTTRASISEYAFKKLLTTSDHKNVFKNKDCVR